MRLFIPILSVLLPAVTPQEGSGFGEDTLNIDGCASVIFPAQHISLFPVLDDFCSAVSTGYGGSLAGCFSSCSGDGVPDALFELDDDAHIASLFQLDFVQNAFDADDNAMAHTKTYACADVCLSLSAPVSAVGGDSDEAVATYIEDLAENAVVAALEAELGSALSSLELNSMGATAVNLDTDLIEGESSGEEPTTEPTADPVSSYNQCLSLYFPALWILQTFFSSIFNFCPVFEHNLCYAFIDAGAACWMHNCDTTCTGDGEPDVQSVQDDDADAAEAADQVEDEHTCWLNNAVNPGADPNMFGCFDVCFEVQATDAQLNAVVAMFGGARFLPNLEDFFESVAEEAVVQTMVAGPSEDGSDGFPGGAPGMAIATENSGAYDCDGQTCDVSNLMDAAASTTFDSEETETASGRNCDDGNNGGCSHVCEGAGLNGICACPNACWELDTDQASCMIPADKVQLSCESDRMIAHLAKCVVEENNNFMLGNDNTCNELNGIVSMSATCQADANITDPMGAGCVSFEVRLDECSTHVEADYANNILTFTQNLVSETQPHMQNNDNGLAIISKAARVSVEFTCEYKTDYETSPGNAIVSPDEVNNALDSQGQFGFNLNTIVRDARMAHTPGWTLYDSQSDPYMVGSTLYFEICAAQTLSNIYFSVPDCTVKNANETESYKIMDNHNLDVFVGTARVGRQYGDVYEDWSDTTKINLPAGSPYPASDEISNQCLVFSYTVFEFITSSENDGDLRLTCDVHACNYDDDEPEDIDACIDTGARKRRDLHLHESYYRVSLNIPIQHTDQV